MKWADEIVYAFNSLGGKASYGELYAWFKTNSKRKLPASWKYIIRARIEERSSDSEAYKKKEDLFYSVDGIGNGKWGLKNWHGDNKNVLPKMASKGLETQMLDKYKAYSRNDVHAIFSPTTKFTPQSGTWGLQGIVAAPNTPGDFVFLVTLGKQQGDHKFDEGITSDGVISWQSQPKQSLVDKQIRQLINHDELRNNIYLFLRTSANQDYTYLGKLKYLSHDRERQHPVYFQWQILEWERESLPTKIISILQELKKTVKPKAATLKNFLENVEPPRKTKKIGITTPTFKSRKEADFSGRDARNKALGKIGELLVLKLEIDMLNKYGKPKLADKVRHASKVLGDGIGYDIESYTPSGDIKFIEVKTSKGAKATPFYMSSNEKAFSKINNSKYYLYRVFEFDEKSNSGKYFILNGDLDKLLDFSPTQYRVSFVSDENVGQ